MGGQHTVKIYRSEKSTAEDSWSHRSIRLEPDSMNVDLKPLVLKLDLANELQMIGEFIGIIS
jgi:hypothetical protein